jgi:nucleoid-associated protein YgaU
MSSLLDRLLGRKKKEEEKKEAPQRVSEEAARKRREELARQKAEAEAARQRFEQQAAAKKKLEEVKAKAAETVKPVTGQAKQIYVVKSGDSLSKIAKQFYGDGGRWPEIYEANKQLIGDNPNLIHPGQQLTIP